MQHKLLITGVTLALLSAAQFSTAEESPSFVARTEALLQKNRPAAQSEAIADSSLTSKAQKTKDC